MENFKLRRGREIPRSAVSGLFLTAVRSRKKEHLSTVISYFSNNWSDKIDAVYYVQAMYLARLGRVYLKVGGHRDFVFGLMKSLSDGDVDKMCLFASRSMPFRSTTTYADTRDGKIEYILDSMDKSNEAHSIC